MDHALDDQDNYFVTMTNSREPATTVTMRMFPSRESETEADQSEQRVLVENAMPSDSPPLHRANGNLGNVSSHRGAPLLGPITITNIATIKVALGEIIDYLSLKTARVSGCHPRRQQHRIRFNFRHNKYSYSDAINNDHGGLSKFHRSILSRNADRQRFVTGKYPPRSKSRENPTANGCTKWGGGRIGTAVTELSQRHGTRTITQRPSAFPMAR
jgi:hypothetical protein